MSRVARNRAESEIEAEMFSLPALTSLVTSMSSSPIASSVDVDSASGSTSPGEGGSTLDPRPRHFAIAFFDSNWDSFCDSNFGPD